MQQKEQRIFEPSLFRQYLRSKMISLLDSIAGRKLIMLQPAVLTPINMIIEKKALSEHGVPDEGGVIAFDVLPIDKNYDQILIFLSPNQNNLQILKELISVNMDKGKKKYYPCFWPKRSIICTQFLQAENLMQYVQIKDFNFDLLPLDIDLYSLQNKCLKDLYINQNHSIYTTVAQSIHRLQCVFGRIHNIYGKGKAARAIYQILRLKQHQIKIDENYGDIQSLIIFDRAIDFLTPLLKQMTYQGLIDQFFGINGGIVKVSAGLFDDNKQKTSSNANAYKKLAMNSQKDYIFQQIRLLTINGARNYLKVRGAQFDQFTQESRALQDMTLKNAAMKRITVQRQYLKNHLMMNSILMQEMKTISFHKQLILQQRSLLDQSQQIIQYNENMIPFQLPLQKILRSMCIQSMVERGVDKKVYARICEDICSTYGIKHIVSLTNLANMRLFYDNSIKQARELFPFSDLKKQLRLIAQGPINHDNPQDICYAYGGYAPIISRLVEGAIRSGWKQNLKALKMLPGQTVMPQVIRECTSHPRPAVVVYFVGGVTYGQIATIRLLGRFFRKEIIIATTQVINGESFIRQLLQ